MSGVTGHGVFARIAKRFKVRSAPLGNPAPIDAEHARQMAGERGLIPHDSGDTERALTRVGADFREVHVTGNVVRIEIHTDGAYWQRHNIPRLTSTRRIALVAVGTIFMEG
jgi:hypothetical protein